MRDLERLIGVAEVADRLGADGAGCEGRMHSINIWSRICEDPIQPDGTWNRWVWKAWVTGRTSTAMASTATNPLLPGQHPYIPD